MTKLNQNPLKWEAKQTRLKAVDGKIVTVIHQGLRDQSKYNSKSSFSNIYHFILLAVLRWLGGVTVRASDLDQAVMGSIHGRAAIKLPRSTQPSILPG